MIAIEFKRAKRVNGPCGKQRDWQSRCGRYRVYESKVTGYADKFYAMVFCSRRDAWVSVERDPHGRPRLHQKQQTAIDACRKHARRAAN